MLLSIGLFFAIVMAKIKTFMKKDEVQKFLSCCKIVIISVILLISLTHGVALFLFKLTAFYIRVLLKRADKIKESKIVLALDMYVTNYRYAKNLVKFAYRFIIVLA